MSTAAYRFWIWVSEMTAPSTTFFRGTGTCLIIPVFLALCPGVPALMAWAATQTSIGFWSLMARRSAPLT